MMKTYTQEEVAQFIEVVRLKLLSSAREHSALADSYLDDPSDGGLQRYWSHKGEFAGLKSANRTLTEDAQIFLGKEATELKPCPCCGSKQIHIVPDGGCYCWGCGLTMPNRPDWRERWNRRVGE